MMTDDKITAVLDTYHDLIRKEREEARGRSLGLREGMPDNRFIAVGPETGRLINVLARSLRAPTILELGTSMGYSGIWLGEAARASGGRLVTVERQAHKSAFAQEMSEKAGLAGHVEFRVGDAVEMIRDLANGIDFVLVDLWKDLYVPCLEAFYPKLNPGAIIVADNIRPDRPDVMAYVRAIRAKSHMSSVTLPVGQGIEVSRYWDEASDA